MGGRYVIGFAARDALQTIMIHNTYTLMTKSVHTSVPDGQALPVRSVARDTLWRPLWYIGTTLTTKTVHASVPDQVLPVYSVARDTLDTIMLQHWRQRLCPYFSTWPGVAGLQRPLRYNTDDKDCVHTSVPDSQALSIHNVARDTVDHYDTCLIHWRQRLCPYLCTWLPGVADPQCCQRHGEIHSCSLQTDSIALNYQFYLF